MKSILWIRGITLNENEGSIYGTKEVCQPAPNQNGKNRRVYGTTSEQGS